jgi:hypothetical protein
MMAIGFELRDEQGGLVESGGSIDGTQLPPYRDPRYPHLGLVDPYGDTMFGRYQMVAVLPELEAWSVERPSNEIAALLELARKCGLHEYLWFVGD